jgi:lysine 6-dehydrogenase
MGADIPDWHSCHLHKSLFGEDIDLVVSAVPYRETLAIAKLCVDNGVRYCDLGGNPQVSDDIQAYSREHGTKPVFTDLGLAPGHANIVAEDYARNTDSDCLFLYVGGLPQRQIAKGRLRYNLVFSIEGLINEYSGIAEVMRGGEIVEVDALTGLEEHGDYEAFYTKGALTGTVLESLKRKGIEYCSYRTIRYAGHRDCMQFLLEETGISGDQVRDIIRSACPPTKQDLVKFYVRYYKSEVGQKVFSEGTTIMANEHWTAMQIGTSYPAAAVASLMAQGKLDVGPVANYWDVDFAEYMKSLYTIDQSVPWDMKAETIDDCMT